MLSVLKAIIMVGREFTDFQIAFNVESSSIKLIFLSMYISHWQMLMNVLHIPHVRTEHFVRTHMADLNACVLQA